MAPAYMSQMASGVRPVPAKLAPLIHAACERQVPLRSLRPKDWLQIWPSLGAGDVGNEVEHAYACADNERRHADRRHAFEPPRDGHWKRAKGRDRRREFG